MTYLSRIAGAGGSDLFTAGTYKTSDGTMNIDGSVCKIVSVVGHGVASSITSGKYYDQNGNEKSLALNILTNTLNDGELVTFRHPLHEIVIAGGPMIFFFE